MKPNEIVTMITAIIGCVLGALGFFMGLFDKFGKAKCKTSVQYISIQYKIIDVESVTKCDNIYSLDGAEETIERFTLLIQNLSSKTDFLHHCSIINFKRNIHFHKLDGSEVGDTSIHTFKQTINLLPEKKPLIFPITIPPHSSQVIDFIFIEKTAYKKSDQYEKILKENTYLRVDTNDEVEFSCRFQYSFYEAKVRANVSYYCN